MRDITMPELCAYTDWTKDIPEEMYPLKGYITTKIPLDVIDIEPHNAIKDHLRMGKVEVFGLGLPWMWIPKEERSEYSKELWAIAEAHDEYSANASRTIGFRYEGEEDINYLAWNFFWRFIYIEAEEVERLGIELDEEE